MKYRFLALASMLLITNAQANEEWSWSNLWRNADQRGDQLLQQGDAAAAARTYTNLRRKAYAELQAGNYAAAAHDLSSFNDSDAHYNRGNALAHTGDLQAALKAYDLAIARNPHNKDAKHNRALVEKALKRQSPQQPPSQPSADNDKKSSSNRSSQHHKGSNQNSSQDSAQQHDQNTNNSGKDTGKNSTSSNQANHSKPPASEKNNGRDSSENGTKNSQSDPHDQASNNPKRDSQYRQGQLSQPPTRQNQADDKSEAHRDAAMSIKGGSVKKDSDGHTDNVATLQNEQQVAQEQWLRQIPEDSGGLLQRKFLIEHMLRKQSK